MPDPAAVIDPSFIDHLLDGLVAAMPGEAAGGEARRAAARVALLAMRPADPVAAMLAAQAIAAHYAAMDAFRRAAGEADDKAAARLRANAASLSRMMQANLKAAEGRREKPPAAPEPARRERPRALAAVPPPAAPPLSAAADARPPALSRNWEAMTIEERRAAYGYRLAEPPPADPAMPALAAGAATAR